MSYVQKWHITLYSQLRTPLQEKAIVQKITIVKKLFLINAGL